jgi:serine/threonine protein kinase
MIAPQTLLQNRYLVLNQIGQGGMGAVYVATDQRFGSTVALKETFFTDPALRRAFEREARLLNRLRHPALPRVSDHFVEEDGQFLVMEYITGEDLWEMLKEQGGAFPLKEVLNWVDQLLDALDYLHTQEPAVIHRDIKPQNLKLTPRGQIILLDFGLAKGTPLQVSQVTATGSIFGYSRNYAPIEQIQGTGTDTRSDLYSLAATIYHLATGTTPPDALTRASAVLNGQPDPLRPANEIHAQVPNAVAQVLIRAMSQNAGLRPQTAEAMREALRDTGKQTIIAGQDTSGLKLSTEPMLEQDTELMAARNDAAATLAEPPHGSKGAIVDRYGPTVLGTRELATSSGTPSVTTSNATAADSVVTEVKPMPTRRLISGRGFGIAAGALILLMIGAVVYALMRRNSAPALVTPPPIQSPEQPTADQNIPLVTPPPNSPSPTIPEAVAPPPKSAKQAPVTTPPVPETPARVPSNRNTEPAAVDPPLRQRDIPGYDPQQIDEARRNEMLMRRRAAQERRLAEEERRRVKEMRRRQRMRRP